MDRAKYGGFPIATACLVAMVLLLVACARDDTELKEPALACQTIKCVCVEPDSELFEAPEKALVLWADNGDAYCPEGFKLRRAKPKDNEFLKKYGG